LLPASGATSILNSIGSHLFGKTMIRFQKETQDLADKNNN
jgi:hypothetical protein